MYCVGYSRRLCTLRSHNGSRMHTLTSDCPILLFFFLLCWINISTGIVFFVCVCVCVYTLCTMNCLFPLEKLNVIL